MSALASILTPAPIRYRDVELTALSFAGEVRYHDRKSGALVFRVSEGEAERLSRVVATTGRAAAMLFLFLEIVARPGVTLSVAEIAAEVGVAEREIRRVLAALVLGGLVRKTDAPAGFEIAFVG